MTGLTILLVFLSAVVILLLVEHAHHRQSLEKIPVRIHVNGTRGKSSVTRLVAAGLRAGGKRTCAKTTGTLARMIFPDGREFPVFRPSRANVLEQLRIIRKAAEAKAEVLVIECMAVQPLLQALCEEKFVRATHGVITNARPDHLDVMGPGEEDVAMALAATVPVKGTLFTAEQKHLGVFKEAADDRGSALVGVSDDEVAEISTEDLAGFKYLEHAENLALALKVCAALGVDRETALRGMWAAKPDPGVLTAHRLDFFGRQLVFVNAFAANDPDSTERIWKKVSAQFPAERRVALVNCRADRPDRSRQLGEACVAWGEADHYVLIGSGTYIFAKEAIRMGLDPGRITYAEDRRIEEIFEVIIDLAGNSALIIGIANIGGQGLELARFFKNRSVPGLKEVVA
ncbi:MAG: poly-gamma-glutamate synthase PgsB [Deltaproteobacteria bacterium]|nr:poly-gamma-glutamate synthase PgsB [Deltaproteobacteria bacterium]